MKRAHALQAAGKAPELRYQDVLARDPRGIPAVLRENAPGNLGTAPVKASRYTSAGFFQKEVEKVWLKTWQYACREEEIPRPGDTYVFDLLDRSLLVVRQHDGALRAFRNVCLHRGRRLVAQSGCKQQFRCPYHGFSWNTDGTFKNNPFKWDFPQIEEAKFSLPEARVESWAGFVFVNFDRDARPLLELLDPIPRHFEHWRIQECYKAAHVGKIAPANWKACAEAFLESHHVYTTHPQALSYIALESTQYDLLSDHVTRFLTPTGVTGTLWEDPTMDERRKIQEMFSVGSRAGYQTLDVELAPGTTARTYASDVSRKALEAQTGFDFSDACDADVLDGIAYDFFPNFHLWGGYAQKICYRYRPVGTDPEKTLVEVMLFKIAPKDRPRPEPAALHMLGENDSWTQATELNYLAGIYDQDFSNLGPLQQGLRAMGDGEIQFSEYMEMRCRNLHRMVDRYIAR